MPVRIAINGVGRIGRALIRLLYQRRSDELELVAVNDLATAVQLAGLLAHDSVHGPFASEVDADGDTLEIDGHRIAVHQEADPSQIPWLDLDPQIVVDATGHCHTAELATFHQRGSVRKIVVSANAEGMDLTLCLGINHRDYDPDRHHLLSAASCTTNCLAPLVFVLDQEFGLRHALFNTVHSYNNDQRLLGFPHRDPRRSRAAALNMIPTTTTASQAIFRILPDFKGHLDGFAVRVPVPNVSLLDLVTQLDRKPTTEVLQQAFVAASRGDLQGILAVSSKELVSTDFRSDTHSAIVDLPLTQSVDRHLYRVVAWYDNEWGHASRLVDILELVGRSL